MRSLMALALLSSLACGDDSAAPDSGTPDVGAMDGGMDASSTAHWIRDDVDVALVPVYAAVSHSEGPVTRQWFPKDLAAPRGGVVGGSADGTRFQLRR